MKHRTKQWLILLYTVLTVASTALCLSPWTWNAGLFGLVWPELLAFALISGWEELTVPGVITTCVLAAGMLLHLAAPVCGFFRMYWPFKALLGVKAVLSLAAFLLLPGWVFGLFLLHGGLFVLATIFFRREGIEAASEGEHGEYVPEEKCRIPSTGLRMPGDGFPDG